MDDFEFYMVEQVVRFGFFGFIRHRILVGALELWV